NTSFAAATTRVMALMKSLSRFRILSPLRHDKSIGVNSLNELLIQHWHGVLHKLPDGTYIGQPIMITENDYNLNLYNGDMGVIFPWQNTPTAWFEDSNANGGLQAIPVSQLPAWETAWAMTVHKAQGAEFNRVLLLLPDEFKPILSRQLIYTALTRAKRMFCVLENEAIFKEAVNTSIQRFSGLVEKLKQ
ncbi:exodeoxyribonuclease V subunit alpha, partial [Candidatus Parcubacteria bacterium]